jgi:putative sigma-54 modulation protein
MKLTITGRHIEVSKKVQSYIRKRFGKWSTFLSPDTEVHVVCGVEGYRQTVEVSGKTGRYTLNGKQTTKDMLSAVDLLAEKIARQLARQHEMTIAKKSNSATVRKVVVPAIKSKIRQGEIVNVQTYAGKPMSREEALLQMQNSKQAFLIFEEADTGQIAVLARKSDGNFILYINE